MYNLTAADEYFFGTDTWVLDLVRTSTGGLVAISSDQKLSLFDPSSLSKGPVSSFQTSHGNVSTLKIFGDNVVCTAGENGTVEVWDLKAGKRVTQFQASQAPIMSMACNAQSKTIAVGTELQSHQASIHLWDVRSTPKPTGSFHDLHSDDITTLSYHPTNPNILLSGSTDGLVNVYDTSITDEDEITIQTLNLNASIHKAAFLSDTLVYALSHDEKFAIYDVSEGHGSGDALVDFGDLRAGVECQYVADIIAKVDGSGAIVGAGAQDKNHFEMVFLTKGGEKGWMLDRSTGVGLPGGHGEEIVRGFCFFDEAHMVFTAGEDGMVKAWKPGN